MSINIGNLTISLSTVIEVSDATYGIARVFVLAIIFFGLLYYLGKLSREGYRLKKPSRFETDLRNYAVGLLITLTLVTMIVIIVQNVPPEILSSPTVLGILGLVEWALLISALFIYLYSKEPRQAIKKTIREKLKESIIFGFSFGLILFALFVLLVLIIPILIIVLYPNQLLFSVYLDLLIVLIACPLLIGRLTPPEERRVSVYLTDTTEPLENLVLYQTTDVDYRFKKGNEEIVIPISRVQKIVYKTPPKEEQKSVSSDEKQGRSPKLRGG